MEVAQIFLDDIDDLLRSEFRLDGLVGQAHSAREQDQEAIQQQAKSLRHLLDLPRGGFSANPLVFAPFEAFFGLHRIDDVLNDGGLHFQGLLHSLAGRLLVALPGLREHVAVLDLVVRVQAVLGNVDLSAHFLVALKLLKRARIQGVGPAHLEHVCHRAVTVTLSIFND